MGLKDLLDEELDKAKGETNTSCPGCGSDETEDVQYYYRCHNTSCPVITFITNDYTVDAANG